MKRTITIVVDDTNSPRDLQRKPEKGLKRIVRMVADQLTWGDKSRDVVDKQGTVVGSWTLTEE